MTRESIAHDGLAIAAVITRCERELPDHTWSLSITLYGGNQRYDAMLLKGFDLEATAMGPSPADALSKAVARALENVRNRTAAIDHAAALDAEYGPVHP
jgi:hypothetical protein